MSDGGTQTKAYFLTETGTRIDCLFNPAELTINRSNQWGAPVITGRTVLTLDYKGASNGTMSFEVFFDTTDTGEAVTTHTGALMALMDVVDDLPGSDPNASEQRPPTVTFYWGDLHSFRAVVASLNVRLLYFSATGVPLRAKVSVSLTQYTEDNAFGPQNPTSGTPRPHTVHRVSPGETLDRIAARHYADPNAWRLIAEANNIKDPLALRPGVLLAIPGRSQ
jgi:LysM repeat protein